MGLNYETIIEKDKLLKAFGVTNIEGVKQFITRIYDQVGFPNNLKDYQATLEIIESIVENAFTKGRMDNNPITLTKKDVLNVLMSIF